MIITLIICITIIIIVATLAVLYYLNTKTTKEIEEFNNDIFNALNHISFYSDNIKSEDIFGENKIYVDAIKDICNMYVNDAEEEE
jgi:hypothetical protein|nr:MAG TPA: hypothetical protein [Crassvirales sp.]